MKVSFWPFFLEPLRTCEHGSERAILLNYLSHLFTNVRNHPSRKVMEFSGAIPISSMTRGEEYKCDKCVKEKRHTKFPWFMGYLVRMPQFCRSLPG
jgi:hypothetical protein